MKGKWFVLGALAGILGWLLLMSMKGILFVIIVIAALLFIALMWGRKNDAPPS